MSSALALPSAPAAAPAAPAAAPAAPAAAPARPVNAGILAMREAQARKRAERAEREAAIARGEVAAPVVVTPAVRVAAQAASRAARATDARKQTHAKASVDAFPPVLWQVCVGWHEGASDALSITRHEVAAPAGAFRRVARLGKAAALAARPSPAARFAGVLAVVRADAFALVAG